MVQQWLFPTARVSVERGGCSGTSSHWRNTYWSRIVRGAEVIPRKPSKLPGLAENAPLARMKRWARAMWHTVCNRGFWLFVGGLAIGAGGVERITGETLRYFAVAADTAQQAANECARYASGAVIDLRLIGRPERVAQAAQQFVNLGAK